MHGLLTSFYNALISLTPFRIKTFHSKCFLKKWMVNFVISFLNINFKQDSIHFLTMKFVDSLMQNNHTV
jgi:hypothetical protein